MYKRLPNQTDPISQNYMIVTNYRQEKFIGSLTTSDTEANCVIHYTDSQTTPPTTRYGFLVPHNL